MRYKIFLFTLVLITFFTLVPIFAQYTMCSCNALLQCDISCGAVTDCPDVCIDGVPGCWDMAPGTPCECVYNPWRCVSGMCQFYSVNEIINYLKKAGFKNNFTLKQTLFHGLSDIKKIEPVKTGYGEGSFVVIRAEK